MFIDRTKVFVKAGKGGNGCISFRRERYVPNGGPDGGDGGRGGNVIFRVDEGQESLIDVHYQQHLTARNGENGSGRDKTGAGAEDLIVLLPRGTVVHDCETQEILADLSEPNQEWIAAKGGRGGLGNTHFKTPENRAPYKSTPGTEGEERVYMLELKSIADVGLVGFPNAGKSTLLSSISNARPKTASYPFTTLNPIIGIVKFPDFFRLRIADIPGLIDGASENVGLGHDFLRHIERCKILIYVLDVAGVDQRNPYEDLLTLQQELELYQPGLSQRASLIVANKIDHPEYQDVIKENLVQLREKTNLPIFEISALEKKQLGKLVNELRRKIQQN